MIVSVNAVHGWWRYRQCLVLVPEAPDGSVTVYPGVVPSGALHNKLCILISIQPGIQAHVHAFGAHQRADPDRSICW